MPYNYVRDHFLEKERKIDKVKNPQKELRVAGDITPFGCLSENSDAYLPAQSSEEFN